MEKKPWEIVVAVLAVLFLCMWGGCGSVTAATEQLGAPDAGAAGMNGGAAGMNGGPAGMNGAAGAAGGSMELGGRGGAAGGSIDAGGAGGAMCVPIDGGRSCTPGTMPCPTGVPLDGCPVGTVKAGPGGACPAGDRYVSLYDICVPSADGG